MFSHAQPPVFPAYHQDYDWNPQYHAFQAPQYQPPSPPAREPTPFYPVPRVPSPDSTIFPEIKTPLTFRKSSSSFSSLEKEDDDISHFAPVVVDTKKDDWKDKLRGLIDKINAGSLYAFNMIELPRQKKVWWSPKRIS